MDGIVVHLRARNFAVEGTSKTKKVAGCKIDLKVEEF
jgi:hypothetical protein